MEDYVYVILFLCAVFSMAIFGFVWLKVALGGSESVKKTQKLQKLYVNTLEEELEFLVKDNKKLKKKITYREGSVGFSDKVDFDSESGISDAVSELLPQIAPFLPKEAQRYLNDPKLVSMALDLYKQNPEKAKSIFSSLIKKGTGGKQKVGKEGGDEYTEIPDFGAGGAV